MKKDYMEIKDDKIIYTDEDSTIIENDNTIIEPIEPIEPIKEIKNINLKKSVDIIIDEDKNNDKRIKDRSEKEFCENFTFSEKNIKKTKKSNYKKFIYILKIVFIILLFLLILNVYRKYNIEKPKETIEETIKEDIIIESIPKTIEQIENYNNISINYIVNLNEIFEGEKTCIDNLKENIITDKDVYNYFMKSINKKKELLEQYLKEKYNKTDINILINNKVNQLYQNSINLSKSIASRYLGSEHYNKMINDMDSFIPNHNKNILEIESLLN